MGGFTMLANQPVRPSYRYGVLNVRALVGTFYREKVLVGAFYVIVKLKTSWRLDSSSTGPSCALFAWLSWAHRGQYHHPPLSSLSSALGRLVWLILRSHGQCTLVHRCRNLSKWTHAHNCNNWLIMCSWTTKINAYKLEIATLKKTS